MFSFNKKALQEKLNFRLYLELMYFSFNPMKTNGIFDRF